MIGSTALTRLAAGAAVAKALEVSPLRATCPDRRPQTAVEESVAAAMANAEPGVWSGGEQGEEGGRLCGCCRK